MSDYSTNRGLHHVERVNKTEFFVYFALIFALAILPHVVVWLYQLIRHARLPRLDPISRALKDAEAVTPMIFRG
ncbi:protein pufQ [Tabrizicola sp. J26]|uniref:cytochrome PufQ n=1 Tax=Alitabrizicola rongguiensis TaxID=2909234 RepID=UPI001EEF30A8|nr:cytochrome PufQ [Tabrizicola rongguiensis]MCF1710674.1 protein pufQ [Tabrizicola rongguiensis]